MPHWAPDFWSPLICCCPFLQIKSKLMYLYKQAVLTCVFMRLLSLKWRCMVSVTQMKYQPNIAKHGIIFIVQIKNFSQQIEPVIQSRNCFHWLGFHGLSLAAQHPVVTFVMQSYHACRASQSKWRNTTCYVCGHFLQFQKCCLLLCKQYWCQVDLIRAMDYQIILSMLTGYRLLFKIQKCEINYR